MTSLMSGRKVAVSSALLAMLLALQSISPLWATEAKNRPLEADKVHIVLLVCGEDDGIGAADLKDVAAMKHVVQEAFAQDPDRLVVHDLTGLNPATGKWYSPEEILEYIRSMNVGPNDTVLVYQSGHGAISDANDPEGSQVLLVNGGRINRKDLTVAAQAQSPRAVIVLTDCCSSFITVVPNPFAQSGARGLVHVNVETVRRLLLTPVGIISVTAAEDGTTASASYVGGNPGNAGSAFTVALMRLFYTADASYTTWEQLFPALRQETFQASGGKHTARAFHLGV